MPSSPERATSGHRRAYREARSAPAPGAAPTLAEERRVGLQKEWHYLFVGALLAILTCSLALANGVLHFVNISSYSPGSLPLTFQVAGYTGMFLTVWISPIPDYVLLPVYGYLCAVGAFNPYTTLLVCVVAAILPIEYAAGRFAGRPLLLKGLSYFGITEGDIEVADNWLVNHGKFSIFTATFIPFFYSVACLAAGTLKMRAAPFLLLSTVGFALRYVFLEYVGFYGIYIFTASYDYSNRAFFALVLVLCSGYAAVHIARTLRSRGAVSPQARSVSDAQARRSKPD